ncbi:P-loop containing nucleoside triphosphate hydrolase protein [Jimgerdemannia flammicorona]|uniref:P-loop containing nucleoside triphosphate hydrolase protein n=1 Tax=Jimgerdemannia flammicorona TaxID=994334 RepID=A0A433DIU4_9FUNG|nr:P-loop containing nucleoside triphosphate hydrolase protein [Jimgerdemannia flammicorona]
MIMQHECMQRRLKLLDLFIIILLKSQKTPTTHREQLVPLTLLIPKPHIRKAKEPKIMGNKSKSKAQNATDTSKQKKKTVKSSSSGKKPSHNQNSIQEPNELTDRHFTLAERMQRIKEYPPDDSQDGPRHDNDERKISNIKIIPTPSEITSSRPPFLPSDASNAASHFLPKGWKRQLDIQFRLSREDMLSDLRDGLNNFIRALDKPPPKDQASLTPLGKRMTDKELATVCQNVNVYESVGFNGLKQVPHRGIGAEMSFRQPGMRTENTYANRREFWMNSKKRLMEQQLVCFLWRAGEEEKEPDIIISQTPFNIVFGVITHRDLQKLSAHSNLAYLTIQFRPFDYIKILEGAPKGNSSENFMIESPSAYFEAFKPILEALKQSPPSTMPFGLHLAQENIVGASANGGVVRPPSYATNFQFDLSVVCRGNSLQLDVRDADSRTNAINGLRKFSDLDDSQAKAVVETLSREVALIQGPPGTGKTKIGIDLVRILLHNHEKGRLGPILCICVTNHALDQFLEHLLDKGVKGIVRVGSQSKTERLDELNLTELKMKQDRPYEVRLAIRELDNEFNEMATKALRIVDAWRHGNLPWRLLGPFLKKRCPKQFVNLDHSTCPIQFPPQTNEYRNPYIHWICGDDIKEKQAEIQGKKKGRDIQKTNRFAALPGEGSSSKGKAKKSWASSVTTDIPTTNRPLAELDFNPNVWHMSLSERKRLVESWKPTVMKSMQRELPGLLQKCDRLLDNLQDKRSGTTLDVFRNSSIIGMTTNGAAKYRDLLRKVGPKVIVCEEAGEVLESHILTALSPHTEHLIMIGDHLQLRPQVNTYRLRTDSGMKYQLDKSLFERLVTATESAALPMSTLDTQRRMRPEIAELIRMTLYPSLIDGGTTGAYPPMAGVMKNLFFMDHHNPQNARNAQEQSFSNEFELKMVKAFAEYIVRNGYDQPGDVAVLTPYLGQLAKLQRTLSDTFNLSIDERDKEQLDQAKAQRGGTGEKDKESSEKIYNNSKALQKQKSPLTLRTIDNFQGEEAKIVIISLVRNIEKDDRRGQIGFLKSENRTNVLLSRAQHGMILFGNAEVMERGSPMWANIVKKLREDGRLGPKLPIVCQKHSQTKNDVDTPENLKEVAPEGGCTVMCNEKMQCGHICPLKCHPHDPKHATIYCLEPCRRYHHACGHPCPKKCGESCGKCEVIVEPITLDCGHQLATPKCWQAQDPSKVSCSIMVERKLLTCEHNLSMKCSADINTVRCTQRCNMPLPCGHKCQRNCFECQDYNLENPTVGERIERINHRVCTSSCDKIRSCGHPCSVKCHPQKVCPQCQPCATNDALGNMETLTLGN